ncbi:MAG TPA: hypothetical protein VF877_11165 [Gaiellaceae bacterium]
MLAALIRERPDQRAALDPVRVDERLDELALHGRRSVESKVEAPFGESGEKGSQRLRVVSHRRTKAQCPAVPEDDVDDSRRRPRFRKGEAGPGA